MNLDCPCKAVVGGGKRPSRTVSAQNDVVVIGRHQNPTTSVDRFQEEEKQAGEIEIRLEGFFVGGNRNGLGLVY